MAKTPRLPAADADATHEPTHAAPAAPGADASTHKKKKHAVEEEGAQHPPAVADPAPVKHKKKHREEEAAVALEDAVPAPARKRPAPPTGDDAPPRKKAGNAGGRPSSTTPGGGGGGGGGGDPAERTLYLEGLPYTASEADIAEFFASVGAPEEIRAPRYHDTGRLLGYAHVQFASAELANAGLALNKAKLGQRYVSVAFAKSRSAGKHAQAGLARAGTPRPQGCVTLFVRGLPYDTDEGAVSSAFSTFGAVVSVRLPLWNHTGRLKGNGYVVYDSGSPAEAAMAAYREGVANGGGWYLPAWPSRALHLDWDGGAPKASFKLKTGQSWAKSVRS